MRQVLSQIVAAVGAECRFQPPREQGAAAGRRQAAGEDQVLHGRGFLGFKSSNSGLLILYQLDLDAVWIEEVEALAGFVVMLHMRLDAQRG